MADNTTLNAGTGGDVIASDDIGGVKHQQVKVEWGVDGTATPVSAANPMPVVQTGTHAVNATLAAETTKVIGTINIAAAQTLATVTTVSAVTAISNALPAGTNAIGKLAANSGVDIGDVDVTTVGTVTPGTAATSLGKAEDAAHSSGDVGVFALGVRQDTAAQLAGTDGDYSPLITDANGRLHTIAAIAASQTLGTVTTVSTVTNVATIGTSVTPGTSAAHLGKAEDAAHSSGDTGVMSLAVRRDADTSLVGTDGDYAPLQVNSAGSLKVAITAGAGSGGTSIADGASFTRDTTSVTPVGAVVETSAPTLTNGDAAGLSVTTGGALRVNVASGGIAGVIEDAASAGGEEGIMVLAVRRDSASSGVGADGDFAALSVTSDGSLRVSGSSGTTQYTEDGASAGGESLCLAGSVRRDTAASSAGTDGDYATLNTDANGRLHTIAALAASQTLATVTNVATIGTSVTPGTAAANLGKAEDAAHSSGDVGVMTLSVRQDTAAALAGTDADYQPLITDASGRLHVNVGNTVTVGSHAVTNAGTFAVQATVAAGATNIAKAEDVASADADVGVPSMAVRKATPANTSGTDGDYEMLQMSAGRLWVDPSGVTLTVASHAVTNAGTFAVQENGTQVQVDDAAFTPATSKVMMAGFTADESSTDSVDEGDGGAARMTLDRKQIVTLQPHTQGGLSIFRSLDIDETEEDVKTSAGQLYFIHAMNMVATARYLKFYNATAANVTVGSTTPVLTFPIPANSTTGAGFTVPIPQGFEFTTAISVACTTGVADADTGAPGANDVIINLGYK